MTVTQVIENITIKLMNGGVSFNDVVTSADTVGTLRESQGLTGPISVNGAVVEDSFELADDMEVVHRNEGQKGGKDGK